MPLPEGYLPRKGDEVLIRARIRYEPDDSDLVSAEVIGREHNHFYVPKDLIHSLHCRKWNEGDRVKWSGFDGPSTVIATHEKWVWIKDEFSDDTDIIFANELEPYVEPAAVETITEAELLAGMEGLAPPPEAPCSGRVGSQSLVGDDEKIG